MPNISPTLRSKIIEILITAFLSALIAALQAILLNYTTPHETVEHIEVAGGIGAAIRGATLYLRGRC